MDHSRVHYLFPLPILWDHPTDSCCSWTPPMMLYRCISYSQPHNPSLAYTNLEVGLLIKYHEWNDFCRSCVSFIVGHFATNSKWWACFFLYRVCGLQPLEEGKWHIPIHRLQEMLFGICIVMLLSLWRDCYGNGNTLLRISAYGVGVEHLFHWGAYMTIFFLLFHNSHVNWLMSNIKISQTFLHILAFKLTVWADPIQLAWASIEFLSFKQEEILAKNLTSLSVDFFAFLCFSPFYKSGRELRLCWLEDSLSPESSQHSRLL